MTVTTEKKKSLQQLHVIIAVECIFIAEKIA